jgi:V8-like Glu-specific endopeptidase
MGIAATVVSMLLSTAVRADFDERVVVVSPTTYPWYTSTKVKINTNGRGSAVVASGCTLLTNGHVVYNFDNQVWNTITSVHPGSYYDEGASSSVDPFGDRVPYKKATNTKWVNTGSKKYDYGAMFVSPSFYDDGITTYIPIVFDYNANLINLAGYPSADLPSIATGANQEQWRGYGDVKGTYTRYMEYEATSTGGASGSPVWVYFSNTQERYLIALNRGHHNSENNGTATRLVSQNETIINNWLNEPCAISAPFNPISWNDLISHRLTVKGNNILIRNPDYFNLVKPTKAFLDRAVIRKVMQWIEGTFYTWNEYYDPQDSNLLKGMSPRRVIQLLKPEKRVLTQNEASVLLSASLLWTRPEIEFNPVYYKEPDRIYGIVPPKDSGLESDAPELGISD